MKRVEVTNAMAWDCAQFLEFAHNLSDDVNEKCGHDKGDYISLPHNIAVKMYAAMVWFGLKASGKEEK